MMLEAGRCAHDHLRYPAHPRCPVCGEELVESIDLSVETGEIVTWTESMSTPPGVRSPNPIAIVEFTIDGSAVRAIGQLTTNEVDIGDPVRPIYTEALRAIDAEMLREQESQAWDGYRFDPID